MTHALPTPVRRYALIAVLALAAGCGPATSVVTGKVTLDGVPVTEGTVSFLMDDGTVQSSFIMPDATYYFDAIPVGTVKITVLPKEQEVSEEDIKNQRTARPTAAKFYIPPRYASPESSGLTCAVTGAKTTHDLPLTK
ncbi:MAG TPA: hypothetical protein VM597_17010 [Gemmataceae bacterium]|nr:hypothetical protein [Gemmataceae bacterium]